MSGVPRSEIWVTSKLFEFHHSVSSKICSEIKTLVLLTHSCSTSVKLVKIHSNDLDSTTLTST